MNNRFGGTEAMDAAIQHAMPPIEVLKRLLSWDHLDGVHDGPWARRMILASLAVYGADVETQRICREEFSRGDYISGKRFLAELQAEVDRERLESLVRRGMLPDSVLVQEKHDA